MAKNVATRVFFGKERQNIGHWVNVGFSVPEILIEGRKLTEDESARIVEFAIGRLFQNALAGVRSEKEINEIWSDILKNLEHGRLSASSGKRTGNPVESRAKGIIAKLLQSKGHKVQQAASLASEILRGERKPESVGLPTDIAERAREKAEQMLRAEQELLKDLI